MERVREQLEGAIQVTLLGLVLVITFASSHIQPWNVPDFRVMRTFVLLELAALSLAYLVVTRARLRRLPGGLLVAAFSAFALLSAAWSPQPGLTFSRALGFAVLIAAAAALALGVAGRPRAAGQLLLALLAAAVIVTLAGLVELWHSPDQAILPATKGQGARYNGVGQNPNQIAMLLALTLPLVAWAVRQATGRVRIAVWVAVLLVVGSLVASGSRGAAIGAFLGCLAYLLAVARGRRLAVIAGMALVFVGAIGAMQLPQPAHENPALYETFGRTPKLSPYDLNSELPLESELGFPGENVETGDTRTLFTSSGRVQAWELAVRQGLERPIAGYGFGTEDVTFVDRSYLFVSRLVENSFIGTFLQLGALGVLLMVAAVAVPLTAWWRALPRLDRETAELASAAAGVVVAGIVVAASQSYITFVGSPPTAPFWIALFLLAGFVAHARRSEARSSP
jgi:hypothetical protein